MLRITPSKNADGASRYFRESLSQQDYYTESKTVLGTWFGKGAKMLGLHGAVKQEDFDALVHNRKPGGVEKLTPRDGKNRRAGYDFTLSATKSVSIVFSLNRDQEILTAHQVAVAHAMSELEKSIQTQIGQGKDKRYKTTGNLIAARFDHFTARPVMDSDKPKGECLPDPHLHSHCFVLNGTYDLDIGGFKAVEMGTIKKEAPYYEALYHSRLAEELIKIGYAVEKSGSRFEIAGISREMINKFSRRTKQIEEIAALKEKLLQQKGKSLWAKDKAAIGAASRISKSKSVSESRMHALWHERLSPEEWHAVQNLKQVRKFDEQTSKSPPVSAKRAVDLALNHFLERKSVISEKRVLGKAMEFGYGHYGLESVKSELARRDDVYGTVINDARLITTRDMLDKESKLIDFVASTRNECRPLHESYHIQNKNLTSDQRHAVDHVLQSKDQVMVVSGAAGSGKTTLFREVAQAHDQISRPMMACAPSAEAVKALRDNGFAESLTIAALLRDKDSSSRLAGKTLLVDEAGMVSINDMNGLFELGRRQDTRFVLSGDRAQHLSVEAGDAMKLIEDRAQIKPAQMRQIMRQKDNDDYRKAVQDMADGKTLKGFDRLDKMGSVHEIEDPKLRWETIASDYIEKQKSGQSVLLVSPTHEEGRQITEIIRERLKENGVIGREEVSFKNNVDLGLTRAEKSHPGSYKPGMRIEFHEEKSGFFPGRSYEIEKVDDKSVFIRDENEKRLLNLVDAASFQVYQTRENLYATGDIVRITKNATDSAGNRLFNGKIGRVERFDSQGRIILDDGSFIDAANRNFAPGYAATSQGSQGKTADHVLIAQSSMSLPASSARQFYVSASRGARTCNIYTDCKAELRDTIAQKDETLSAHDLKDKAKEKQLMQDRQDKITLHSYETYMRQYQQHEKQSRDVGGRIHGTDRSMDDPGAELSK